jgi:endonuclease III
MVNINKIYAVLEEQFQKFQTPIVDLVEAQTKDPFKILVATILSARTNDKTTAQVVKKLFQIVHKADDFDKYSTTEIEKLIYPVGFFRNKALHLQKLPRALNELFGGEIPDEIDDLVKLPGVGRKTANLVRAVAFKKPAICVDVHVHRICNRFGYVKTKTPFDTEMALRKKLPEEMWININSYLVSFGQNHCSPRNPKCNSCVIYDECKRVGVITKYEREI